MVNVLNDISLAFFGSIGHCFFMCGGFIAAFNHKHSDITTNIIYHSGRIFVYMLLGGIFAGIGSAISLSSFSKGVLFFIIGVFMMVFAVAFVMRGRFLAFFESNNALKSLLIKLSQKAFRLSGAKRAFLLGCANGFLPCGLVYVFVAKALTQDILHGIITMSILGLMSACVMIFFACFMGFLRENFAKLFLIIGSVIIFINGVFYAYSGLELSR